VLSTDWDVDLDAALRRIEDYVNVLLERQYDQLADSLRDFLYDLLNYPLKRPWRESLAIFADHWEERGLKLTPRTLNAIGDLIEAELGDRSTSPADDTSADGAPQILLAVYQRPRRRTPAKKGAKGRSRGSAKSKPKDPYPHGKRLPAGKWVKGSEGNGVYKLENPIKLPTGKIVDAVEYREGLPVFDKWALKGEDVTIALTGKHTIDRQEALKAWSKATGRSRPQPRYVFHHDGLTTDLGTYQGRSVFVGRMQLIPEELNKLPHIGSARMARQFTLDPVVAREVNYLALKGKGPLVAARRRVAGMIAKRSRKVARMVPIIGGAVSLVFFAEDVEAHGLGGALVRATPLLGDLVSAYDLGRELAEHIEAQARSNLEKEYEKVNRAWRRAHAAAMQLTSAEFNKLAQTIHVSKRYIQPEEILNAIQEPLNQYYGEVHSAYVDIYRDQSEDAPDWSPPSPSDNGALQSRLQRAKERLERNLKDALVDRGTVPFS
jgi:hypothetical protein